MESPISLMLQCLSLPFNFDTLSDKIGSRWISLLSVGMGLSLLRLLILTGNASFWTNDMILQADYIVRSILRTIGSFK